MRGVSISHGRKNLLAGGFGKGKIARFSEGGGAEERPRAGEGCTARHRLSKKSRRQDYPAPDETEGEMSFEASALFLSRLHFTVARGIPVGDRMVTAKANARILFNN